MRAVLINVDAKSVTEVDITDDIETMYAHLGCECFCSAGVLGDNMLLVDDEGLLHHPIAKAFCMPQIRPDTFLVGNGLLVGYDPITGETIDCNLPIESLTIIFE